VNTHSYLREDILAESLNEAVRGTAYTTPGEIQRTTGQSGFDPIGKDIMPLVSLRENLMYYRTFFASVIAVLAGFVFQCFICGHSHRRAAGDACSKVWRAADRGKSWHARLSFWLPGAVLWQPSHTEPMLEALHVKTKISSSCSNSDRSSQFQAAENRAPQDYKDQHGVYACTCGHECCICAYEMHRPESISSHVVLALVIAFALGCNIYFNDVMCILRAHVKAQKGRELQMALSALVETMGNTELATMVSNEVPILLTVVGDEGATFTVRSSSVARNCLTDAEPDQGSAPSLPSHFGVSVLIQRLVHRANQTGQLAMLLGAIPSLHAYLHQCSLGAFATPGAGAGHEYPEWLNSQALSPFASVVHMSTSTVWRLFLGNNLLFYNQRKNLDIAHRILQMWVRAQVSVQQRHDVLVSEKAVCTAIGLDVSNERLQSLSAQFRSSPANQSAETGRVSRAAKAIELSAVVGALDAIDSAVSCHAGDDSAKESLLLTLLGAAAERGIKLPSIASVFQLGAERRKQKSAQRQLLRDMSGTLVPDANAAIALQLKHMHDFSTALSHAKMRLQLHLIDGGANDVKSKALRVSVGAARNKLKRCILLLQRLLPLSTDDAVKRWKIPELEKISGPGDLPSTVGPIEVVAGSTKLLRLVEAHDAHRAAVTQLQLLTEEIGGTVGNLDAVIRQQISMLQSLATGDLERGSGASGLVGGPTDAMFNLSNLRSPPGASCHAEIAAGIAHHVARGLKLWREQRVQVALVLDAIQFASTTPRIVTDYVTLFKDKAGRCHAMRYARRLLSGEMSPRDWATVSVCGELPLAANIQRPRVTARRSDVQMITSASAPLSSLSACDTTSASIDEPYCSRSAADAGEAAFECEVDEGSDDELDEEGDESLLERNGELEDPDAVNGIWNDSDVTRLLPEEG
jgi:hypothetical protein